MAGDNTVLAVRSRPHLGRASQQNADLAFAHFRKQFRFLRLRVCVMDKGDLFSGNAHANQLIFNVIVDIKFPVIMGRGLVAENQLRSQNRGTLLPDLKDVLHTGDLAVGIVREQRVHQPLVQGQLASVSRDGQHIVLVGFHRAGADFVGAFPQFFHHLFLEFAGFRLDNNTLRFGDRQLEHIRRLNVGGFFPNADEFRQIVESCKAGLGAESAALRLQFHRRDLFPEVRRPVVKVPMPVLVQRIKL